MSAVQIIDTFPAYLSFWSAVAGKDIEQQIEQWHSEYMSNWPELRKKIFDDYANQDIQWFQIAKKKIFPYLSARLTAMKVAHAGLLESCSSLLDLAQERLGFNAKMISVIYVGPGNGAGWVTTYSGKPEKCND